MQAIFFKIIHISRPHLWLYTLGSFLFGIHIASVLGYEIPFLNTLFLMIVVALPVNYAIYALNDYYDESSDALNPKKNELEYKASVNEKNLLYSALATFGLITIFFIATQDNFTITLFTIWLVSVLLYNVPPFRFKARPGLDMVCAIIYPIWGMIGYISAGGTISNYSLVLGIFLLSCSFHLYSAIQDIPYDKQARIITSAVFISSPTLNILICILLVSLSIIPIIEAGLIATGIVTYMYSIFYSLHLCPKTFFESSTIEYKHFIYTQFIIGMISSLTLFLYY